MTLNESEAPTAPNLLFVFPDQMRAFSCGYREADPVLTPRLDAFAKQGLTLTHAVSNYPVCSPWRAMFMTGRYPLANGVLHNCNSDPRRTWELRESDTCLTDVLAGAGYSVGYVGKWHLERPREPYVMPPGWQGLVWNEYTPPHRRHGIGYWHGYNTYDNHLAPEYWVGDAPRDQRTRFDQWSPEHEADVAIDFLRNTDGGHRDADKPFALFVSNNPPHTPFDKVPDRYLERYGDAGPDELLNRPNVELNSDDPATEKACGGVKGHFAMVTGVDEQFGRLLDELDALGLAENTLVIFTSDHGEMMGSHRWMHKDVWYDESLRVPFIARMPGVIPAGASDDLLLSTPDLMPTLLGLLGLADRIPSEVQGANHSGLLRGQPGGRPASALYLRHAFDAPGLRGVRTHRHTLVLGQANDQQPPILALYDNREDPYQLQNVAGQQPQPLRDTVEQLRHWLDQTDDPFDVDQALTAGQEATTL